MDDVLISARMVAEKLERDFGVNIKPAARVISPCVSEVLRDGKTFNLYIKVCNPDRPYWNITANRVTELDNDILDYDVLLVDKDGGIVLTSAELKSLLDKMTPATDGKYKLKAEDIATAGVGKCAAIW